MKNIRRKRYCRRLEHEKSLKPKGIPTTHLDQTTIYLDEFEAMRLVDTENFSQVEAAKDMEVSRATIQRLLESGRRKLVEGVLHENNIVVSNDIYNIKLKGENRIDLSQKSKKIIAFPTSDKVNINELCDFTEEFGIYTIEGVDIVNIKHIAPNKKQHSFLPNYLSDNNVDVVVTGCMSKQSIDEYKNKNIDVILGAIGRIDVNLNEYLGGFLTPQGIACDPKQ